MRGKPDEQRRHDARNKRRAAGVFRLEISDSKLRVPFVISLVVAYRLLDTGMDLRVDLGVNLGVESAVAFGSKPQQ
jgi:hypothetical protein